MTKILLIDDDNLLFESLALRSEINNYLIINAATGNEGLKRIRGNNLDIILLELDLPDKDGKDILKEIRKINDKIPVIIVTKRNSIHEQIAAFFLKADDYLIKPINIEIIFARIFNSLNHKRVNKKNGVFQTGHFLLDYDAQLVKVQNNVVNLTALEYEILSLLTRHPNEVLSYDFILNNVSTFRYAGDIETIRVEINRLRKKIEEKPQKPRLILSKYGIGYRFCAQE